MSLPEAATAAVIASQVIWPGPLSTTGQPRTLPLAPRTVAVTTVTRDTAGIATLTTGPGTLDAHLDTSLLFAKDSATIQPAARERLAQIASQASTLRAGTLQITGYTDDLGTTTHGLQLSQQRAQAVANLLRTSTPTTVSLQVTGRGEEDPIAPNTDEANRAKNRRVELHFLPTRHPQ